MLRPEFSAIPAELRKHPRWVVWKENKVPYCATALESKASVIQPETWSTFGQATTAYEEGGYDGVGFVLNGDGIVGIDLDKCCINGNPDSRAIELLERIGCNYVELSPSGTGLRGFGYGETLKGRRGEINGIRVELYSTKRYLTVTGQIVVPGPIVKLPGLTEIAAAISAPDLQRRTEDDRCSPLSSSVGSSADIPVHTLPSEEGQRNRCIFDLARYLKGRYPNHTRDQLRTIVGDWHQLAVPVIGTKDFGTTWADFQNAWKSVRHPYGSTMQPIIDRIDFQVPLPSSMEKLQYGPAGQHLIRLCMALQEHHGDAPFFVSARQAAEVIGVHFTDAAKMLQALVLDGVLKLISKGAGKIASRYRFTWAGGGVDTTS